jgi:tetratricopeptide (TPR) repeat protein
VTLADQAIAAIDPARDPVRLARIHMLSGRAMWLNADHAGALAAYREAVRLVPPDPPSSERALVLAGEAQALMLSGRTVEAYVRCEEALDLARALGDRLVQAHVHNTLAGLGWSFGDPIEHAATARRIAFELGAIEEIGRSYANGSEALDYVGRTEDAIALAQEGIAAAPRWGLRDFVLYLSASVAGWQLPRGRHEEARRLCEETTPRGHTAAAPRHRTLGRLASVGGEFATAEVELRRAEELARGLGGAEWWPAIQADIAMLALWQGRLDDAAQAAREALDAVDDPEYGPWLPDFADVYPTAARIEADRADQARADGASTADAEAAAADALARLDSMLAGIPQGHLPPRPVACRSLVAAEVIRAGGRSEPTRLGARRRRVPRAERAVHDRLCRVSPGAGPARARRRRGRRRGRGGAPARRVPDRPRTRGAPAARRDRRAGRACRYHAGRRGRPCVSLRAAGRENSGAHWTVPPRSPMADRRSLRCRAECGTLGVWRAVFATY